jgi:hypothetical protein
MATLLPSIKIIMNKLDIDKFVLNSFLIVRTIDINVQRN